MEPAAPFPFWFMLSSLEFPAGWPLRLSWFSTVSLVQAPVASEVKQVLLGMSQGCSFWADQYFLCHSFGSPFLKWPARIHWRWGCSLATFCLWSYIISANPSEWRTDILHRRRPSRCAVCRARSTLTLPLLRAGPCERALSCCFGREKRTNIKIYHPDSEGGGYIDSGPPEKSGEAHSKCGNFKVQQIHSWSRF